MESVIALLQQKNQYLEKFYWVNEQELMNLAKGNFDGVEEFYEAREKILELIAEVDRLLGASNDRVVTGQIADQCREDVEEILGARDELVKAILDQDLQVLALIENEKSNIIRELKANSHAKKVVGAYASAERLKLIED